MKNEKPCLHIFGSLNALAAGILALAKAEGWNFFFRTSERLRPSESDLAKLSTNHYFIANSLDEVMQGGPAVAPNDIAISLGAPWIFSKAWIDRWQGRAFNFHCRPLPWHRGAGGASWLIMMGQSKGAATIHRISEKVDEGEIVAQKTFEYPHDCRFPEDFDAQDSRQSLELAALFLPRFIRAQGTSDLKPPAMEGSSYWPRLSTEIHGWVDWDWDVTSIVRFVQAFDGMYGGASSEWNGKRVRLSGAERRDETHHHPFQSGLVFCVEPSGCWVAARDGSIFIQEIKDAESGLRVHPKCGDRLFSPRERLEEARRVRVQYSPDGKLIRK